MMYETHSQVLEALSGSLPNYDQCKNFEFEPTVVYFTWRGSRFRVEMSTGGVWEIERGLQTGSNEAILIRALMKKAHYASLV